MRHLIINITMLFLIFFQCNMLYSQISKDDAFSGNQWFFGEIKFIRDANNAIRGCKISSQRARNILFKKQ